MGGDVGTGVLAAGVLASAVGVLPEPVRSLSGFGLVVPPAIGPGSGGGWVAPGGAGVEFELPD